MELLKKKLFKKRPVAYPLAVLLSLIIFEEKNDLSVELLL